MAYTRYSKKLGPGQNLYTQKFRIQVRILVVGVYSILEFFGAGQAPDLERIQKARKVRPRAGSVYSNFPGPGRFLFWGVYRKLEKPGPGRNPYTQIFRAQADSWSIAYTESSKSLGQGEICILKNSGPRQVPVLGRIQDTRKNWAQGEIRILKNSEPRQIPGR